MTDDFTPGDFGPEINDPGPVPPLQVVEPLVQMIAAGVWTRILLPIGATELGDRLWILNCHPDNEDAPVFIRTDGVVGVAHHCLIKLGTRPF